MIEREAKTRLTQLVDRNPAVVLIGPRQVGKTTLALAIASERPATYVDLERPSHLARVGDIEQYCDEHAKELVILDEVHRTPDLFAPLRGIIDERRRAGRAAGSFLLLGSASIDLLTQSGETLAGRLAIYELHPLSISEVPTERLRLLWCRGGFPESYLAAGDPESLDWRLTFIETYLQRDIPQFGPRIPAETLRRFWTMLAHNQGQTYNAAALARGLDVSGVTIGRYLDLMVDLLLVRRLQPWTSNLGRRLVKAPKVYLRDSGVCHALLGIETLDELLGHPVIGGSWEGFIIENVLRVLPPGASWGYYRTARGAEVDLIVEFRRELWAIEVKRSSAPAVSKGFHSACEDLRPTRKFVVHGGPESFPLARDVRAVTLPDMVGLARDIARPQPNALRKPTGPPGGEHA